MKRLSWKYVAGLIDGEGCIDFQNLGHRDYPDKLWITPRVRVTLSQPAQFVLEMLKANHDGGLHKRPSKNEAWQDAWTWQIQGKKIRPFLQNIVNHLFIKKEQARFAIWVLDNVAGRHISDEMRRCAIDEMKAMKRDPQRLSVEAAKRVLSLMR